MWVVTYIKKLTKLRLALLVHEKVKKTLTSTSNRIRE